MKIFNRKRVALGLIVILVIAAFFGYKNKDYIQQLPIEGGEWFFRAAH
jgi:hypothetical protein